MSRRKPVRYKPGGLGRPPGGRERDSRAAIAAGGTDEHPIDSFDCFRLSKGPDYLTAGKVNPPVPQRPYAEVRDQVIAMMLNEDLDPGTREFAAWAVLVHEPHQPGEPDDDLLNEAFVIDAIDDPDEQQQRRIRIAQWKESQQ